MKLSRLGKTALAVALSGAVVCPTAFSTPPPTVDEQTQDVVETTSVAAQNVGQVLELEDLQVDGEAARSQDNSVVVDETAVTIDVGAGIDLRLGLPNGLDDSPTLSEDGTAVVHGDDGLSFEVQNIEDGTARLMTVAEENYSADPIHRYEYEVALPAGSYLTQLPDGTAAVVQDQPEQDVPQSVLEEVLPDTGAALEAQHEPDPAAEPEAQEPVPAPGFVAEDLESIVPEPVDTLTDEQMAELAAGPAILVPFSTPWAVDAEGRALETELVVEDGKLVQQVDTTGAAFPVVSDPLPLVVIGLGLAARALAPHAIRAFAGTVIRGGLSYTIRGGYRTFPAFKRAHGTKPGYQWHHIVEQSTIRTRGYDPRAVHNQRNLVQIPTRVHQSFINKWMGTNGVKRFGANAPRNQSMRSWVNKQSWQKQHQIGVSLLRHCGVRI